LVFILFSDCGCINHLVGATWDDDCDTASNSYTGNCLYKVWLTNTI